MTKKEYFVLRESLSRPGWYLIEINFNNLPNIKTSGSFSLLAARVMNLTQAQYLRFCRDIIGAEIQGKNSLYPIPYFKKRPTTASFVRLLNTRMQYIMWEKEHPDWKQHQDYLEKKKRI
jgi:hypothetical protein